MSGVTAKDLRELIQHYAPPHLVEAELAAFDEMAEKAELLDTLLKMTKQKHVHVSIFDYHTQVKHVYLTPDEMLLRLRSSKDALKAVPCES